LCLGEEEGRAKKTIVFFQKKKDAIRIKVKPSLSYFSKVKLKEVRGKTSKLKTNISSHSSCMKSETLFQKCF